ncbi:MAG: hypothetical protein ACN4E2_04435, partial [Nitrospinota bacterium]
MKSEKNMLTVTERLEHEVTNLNNAQEGTIKMNSNSFKEIFQSEEQEQAKGGVGEINLVSEEEAQPQESVGKINLVSEEEGQPQESVGKINLVNEEQAQPQDTIEKINLVSE